MLRGVSIYTPMEESRWLSALAGGPVLLKAENLQRTGSFKIRGAYLRMSRLSAEEQAHGVVAASAGNHAQGVALAAQLLGITRHGLHAGGRADPQGEGHPGVRRRGALPRAQRRRGAGRGQAVRRRDRRGADPPLRPRRHRRRPGHLRPGDPRAVPRRAHRARPDRRRRVPRRHRDGGQGACVPTYASSACRPRAPRRTRRRWREGRPVAARRRCPRWPTASRSAAPARCRSPRSSSTSTRSSPCQRGVAVAGAADAARAGQAGRRAGRRGGGRGDARRPRPRSRRRRWWCSPAATSTRCC